MSNQDIKKEFGKRVRFYRKNLELSQEKFAELAGTTVQTLSGIETGYSFPSYNLLTRIIKALGVAPAKLFLFDDDTFSVEDNELQYLLEEKFKNLNYKKRKIIFTIIDALSKEED